MINYLDLMSFQVQTQLTCIVNMYVHLYLLIVFIYIILYIVFMMFS